MSVSHTSPLALCPLHLCLCFSAVEDPHSIGISFTSLKLCLFSLFCLLLLCDSHSSLDHVVLFPLSLFFHSSTSKSEIGLTSSSFLQLAVTHNVQSRLPERESGDKQQKAVCEQRGEVESADDVESSNE